MFSEFLNKKCVVITAFGTSIIRGGATPRNIYGTLIGEDEDYIIIDVEKSTCDSVMGAIKSITGKTYINKKFIIAINFC